MSDALLKAAEKLCLDRSARERELHNEFMRAGNSTAAAMRGAAGMTASDLAAQIAALASPASEVEPVAWEWFREGKWQPCSYFVAHNMVTGELDTACRALYAHPASDAKDAERDAVRYRWLREHINYRDEVRGLEVAGRAGPLTWRVRAWTHDSNDFVSDTLDAVIDTALTQRAEGK